MYCPRCSQEQISEDLRFCSRCGFPLALVSSVVAAGGIFPQTSAPGNEKKTVLTRRSGLIFSLFWFMFFTLLLSPIFGGVVRAEALALAAALVGTIGGLMLMLASFFVLKKDSETESARLTAGEADARAFAKNFAAKNQNALPSGQSISASTHFPRGRDTKDLIQPSVTEGTTKLLEKDKF